MMRIRQILPLFKEKNSLFIKNPDQMGDRLTGQRLIQTASGRISQNSLMQRADGGNNQGYELTDAERFHKNRIERLALPGEVHQRRRLRWREAELKDLQVTDDVIVPPAVRCLLSA